MEPGGERGLSFPAAGPRPVELERSEGTVRERMVGLRRRRSTENQPGLLAANSGEGNHQEGRMEVNFNFAQLPGAYGGPDTSTGNFFPQL